MTAAKITTPKTGYISERSMTQNIEIFIAGNI